MLLKAPLPICEGTGKGENIPKLLWKEFNTDFEQ